MNNKIKVKNCNEHEINNMKIKQLNELNVKMQIRFYAIYVAEWIPDSDEAIEIFINALKTFDAEQFYIYVINVLRYYKNMFTCCMRCRFDPQERNKILKNNNLHEMIKTMKYKNGADLLSSQLSIEFNKIEATIEVEDNKINSLITCFKIVHALKTGKKADIAYEIASEIRRIKKQ